MVRLTFPSAQLAEVLAAYETLVDKPVYLGTSLAKTTVSVATEEDLPRSKAAQLIRKTLSENYGIELVDGHGAVFTVAEKYRGPKEPSPAP